jgi:hypothetical protein
MLASASVIAGVVYYAFQIRNQTRMRQTDLVTRLYSVVSSKEFLEAWEKIRDREIKSYDDYKEKYGFLELNQVMAVFDEVGVLLQRRLVDIGLVDALFGDAVKDVWEKVKPVTPIHSREPFEYLYNEVKKREQKLQSKA